MLSTAEYGAFLPQISGSIYHLQLISQWHKTFRFILDTTLGVSWPCSCLSDTMPVLCYDLLCTIKLDLRSEIVFLELGLKSSLDLISRRRWCTQGPSDSRSKVILICPAS